MTSAECKFSNRLGCEPLVARNPRFELREWQRKALHNWKQAGYRGIVEVITGGGKTRFAIAAISTWLELHPNAKVCVLVPTAALQDQWAVTLTDDLAIETGDLCLWPEDRNPSRKFHILIANTARTAMPEIAGLTTELMLVADECHRFASPKNKQALVDAAATLGLSATARRARDTGYEDVLVPRLGPTIYEYGLEQGRDDEIIAPFSLRNVQIELLADEAAEYHRLSRRLAQVIGDGDENLIKRIALARAGVSKKARMRIPVSVAVLDGYRGVRCLVFHEDIASANTITRLLGERGHSVGAFHTGIGPGLRRDNLRQFRNGWIDILVSCRALDEGIDVPHAEMAVIASSTSSERQRIQRLGRVIRPAPGKEAALIVTIFATEAERERLVAEQLGLDGIVDVTWQRAEVNNASNLG